MNYTLTLHAWMIPIAVIWTLIFWEMVDELINNGRTPRIFRLLLIGASITTIAVATRFIP